MRRGDIAKLLASFIRKRNWRMHRKEQIRQVLYGEGVAANVSIAEADSLFQRDESEARFASCERRWMR